MGLRSSQERNSRIEVGRAGVCHPAGTHTGAEARGAGTRDECGAKGQGG